MRHDSSISNSSANSITLYVKNLEFPQKEPRSTAYTDVKISPGIIIRKITLHLSSENNKLSTPLSKSDNKVSGAAIAIVNNIPAVTASLVAFLPVSARVLVISLETVIGIPDDVIVINKPKTEREIW